MNRGATAFLVPVNLELTMHLQKKGTGPGGAMPLQADPWNFGSPADSGGSPMALRPHLAMGLPFRVLAAESALGFRYRL